MTNEGSPKVMSKSDIQRLLHMHSSDATDDEAYDIADGLLFDNEGLEAGIKKHFGVRDVQGWLADRV